jgi:hypothetical protein
LLLALGWTIEAAAHAIIMESNPAVNAVVVGPDVPLELRYNSRIDKGRSRLLLLSPDKSTRALVIPDQGAADRIASEARGLTPGAYQIEWQVLGVDGHITRGFIPFTVTAP